MVSGNLVICITQVPTYTFREIQTNQYWIWWNEYQRLIEGRLYLILGDSEALVKMNPPVLMTLYTFEGKPPSHSRQSWSCQQRQRLIIMIRPWDWRNRYDGFSRLRLPLRRLKIQPQASRTWAEWIISFTATVRCYWLAEFVRSSIQSTGILLNLG